MINSNIGNHGGENVVLLYIAHKHRMQTQMQQIEENNAPLDWVSTLRLDYRIYPLWNVLMMMHPTDNEAADGYCFIRAGINTIAHTHMHNFDPLFLQEPGTRVQRGSNLSVHPVLNYENCGTSKTEEEATPVGKTDELGVICL